MKTLHALALLPFLSLPALAEDAPEDATKGPEINELHELTVGPDGKVIAGASKLLVDGKEVDPNSKEGKALLKDIGEDPKTFMVDGNSPEAGQQLPKHIAEAMKGMDKQIAEQIKKETEKEKAAVRTALGLTSEEVAAVEPLLARVERLTLQKNMLDRSGDDHNGSPGEITVDPVKIALGDAAIEPSYKECQAARKAMDAILGDKQVNAAELSAAMARVRKAHAAFDAVLVKAQAELKAVLTPRSEALLMQRGFLD